MEQTVTKTLVKKILQAAEVFPWRMQSIGLMSLCLDDHRERVLHVWGPPSETIKEPPIHDHPFDFISTIIVGEITNTRYKEDSAGTKYFRFRYSPAEENSRQSDTVRLSRTSTTYIEGGHYQQLAHDLHDSRQLPGTVTLLRRSFKEVEKLTVCFSQPDLWISGKARPATYQEIKRMTSKALEWF
jgi:hypothetical protein